MLKNKEIEEKFGIAGKTLYNWSSSRPELYEFLKKSDEYFDKIRDFNILLRSYEKSINPIFTISELNFLIDIDYRGNLLIYLSFSPKSFWNYRQKN